MAKREIRMTVCSNCIESFPDKDLYVVVRKMHGERPEGPGNEYLTPYCEPCLVDKDTYIRIAREPKKAKVKPSKK